MTKHQVAEVLDLVRGNVLLGTIEVKKGDADLPWRSGLFRASPAYESVRGLFERELEMLQANTTDDAAQWDDWEEIHAQLHEPGLRLRDKDGAFGTDEIIIHINGTEAWWRSDGE